MCHSDGSVQSISKDVDGLLSLQNPKGHRTRSMGFKAERSEALREGVRLFFLINIKFICTLLGTRYWNSHGAGRDTALEVT